MGNGIFIQKIHTSILFWTLALIAIGLPSTKILLSIGFVLMIANWIFEGNFVDKWRLIQSNSILKLLLAFYALLIIGLIWSWDVGQGLKDIKSRLPFLFIPLIIGTSPLLEEGKIRILLNLLLASLVVTSVFNVLYYNHVFGYHYIDDIRGMSRFASHIRYAILIAMGFAICIWFQMQSKRLNLVYSLLALWFAFYTVYSQVLSGILAFSLIGITLLLLTLYKFKKFVALLVGGLVILVGVFVISWFFNVKHEYVDCNQLPKETVRGVKYNHNCETFSEFNGQAIFKNYSEIEMFHAWLKVSDVDFMGLDAKGGLLRVTACRYMTSLGLTKDADGMKYLTAQDIRNIEDGYVYRTERDELFMPRIYGVKYQILNPKDPNGHSLLQRLEHWKAAFYIIKKYGVFGVGTGGNQKAFDKAYDEINSPLSQENRVRAHNMFLTYTISYGLVGLFLFSLIFIYLLHLAVKYKDLLSLLFLVIIISSFFLEDTLETQVGVTIVGFVVALQQYFLRSFIQRDSIR